jgi:hypothetical protein
MTEIDLSGIVDALHAKAARRLNLGDDIDMSHLVDQHLQLSVLRDYQRQLAGREGLDAFAWLIDRMARIEAIILSQQAEELRPETIASKETGDNGAARVADLFLPPDAVTVDFDEDLNYRGFYQVETDSEGRSYRWLGPDPVASVFLPRMLGPVRIVIKVLSIFSDFPIANTRISIDGGEWVYVAVEQAAGVTYLTATTPLGEAGHASTMRLDMDCGETQCPASRDGASDQRCLGFAVTRVELSRIEPGSAK